MNDTMLPQVRRDFFFVFHLFVFFVTTCNILSATLLLELLKKGHTQRKNKRVRDHTLKTQETKNEAIEQKERREKRTNSETHFRELTFLKKTLSLYRIH